ncbi:hypothetical protein L686_09720 [Stutzerimonas stutzeri MF28]|jgi:hypothetical protein|nr:hypothetical protein L686_09720 [Stutzerimonas stutzeri MF28]
MSWSGSVYRDGANYISLKNDTESIRLMVLIARVDPGGQAMTSTAGRVL